MDWLQMDYSMSLASHFESFFTDPKGGPDKIVNIAKLILLRKAAKSMLFIFVQG